MTKITNIYILVDTSYRATRSITKIQELLFKIIRTLGFIPYKTRIHIWGYNDKATVINPKDRIIPEGNPDLSKGLEAIENAILYERKYPQKQTRSIFLLFGSSRVLDGWQKTINRLFKLREFAFGHRYVICKSIPESFAHKAYKRFTDSDEKILSHFSENRLASLIADIHTKDKKKCYNSYILNIQK